MLLTQRLAHFFPSAVRKRGEEYISPNVTSITEITHRSVDAIAHGSEDYDLQLEWGTGSDKLFATCTCPYAADQGLCKHVWGLLRQLETIHKSNFPKRFQSIFEGPMVKAKPRPTPAAPSGLSAIRDLLKTRDLSENEFESAVNALLDSDDDDLEVLAPPSKSKRRAGPVRGSSVSAPRHALEPWQFRELLGPWARPGTASDAPPLHYSATIRAIRDGGELCVLMFQAQQVGDSSQRYVEIKPEQVLNGQTDVNEDDHEIVEELQTYETDFWGRRPSKSYLTLGDNPFKTLQQLFLTSRLYFAHSGTGSPDHPETKKIEYLEQKPLTVRQRIDELVGGDYLVRAQVFNSQGKEILERPRVSTSSGLLLFSNWIARLPRKFASLFQQVTAQEPVRIPAANATMLSRFVYENNVPLAGELPKSLRLTEVVVKPKGLVRFEQHSAQWFGTLAASYDDVIVEMKRLGELHFSDDNRLVRRNKEAENGLINEAWGLEALELGRVFFQPPSVRIPKPKFTTVLRYFLERGWIVEANKKRIGSAAQFDLQVTSGIDWFDVDGQMAFGDTVIPLPQILKRIEPGNLVRLENGQFGMLPDGWMEQFGRLLQLGEQTENHLRFRRAQGFLLDALLAERTCVTFDQKFIEFQQRVQQFAGIREVSVPSTFQGKLRGYQREGHNWLHFLREFGLGGCLADDMGLGKTVQVLALLETRRLERLHTQQPHKPTLLVVPKSLVFNWMAEAERFTPQLKFLNYSGQNRKNLTDQIASADVVLTTYATMRIDIGMLKDIEFDYAILDEAQAIKNAQALTAKAALLIRADHRLALSGTPIENRLADLWSIFEFLNPGMLGICSVFTELGRGEATQDTLRRLGQALKPMLLRRTKDQVLKDLPAKNEQTIVCELEPKQRKLYDEVLRFYRQSLTARINKEGLNKSKIHVLEALTRLRQIACHPALIDPAHSRVKSAKLEALYENLESVIGEGHKALVFSQFTSLLAIVRQELDKRQFTYEYLDGQTSNRKRCVERFNGDPKVSIFLLSLKAGGHGLNLTAADYVFILDPWWNPAAEAQAIDRAHRIGQTKPVFAYRMIAKDTVEEKIVALQQSKRELAEAIVRADSSVIKNLSMDDLQLLLT